MDAVLTLTAFDKTGRLLAGPGIRNPITMPLRVGTQSGDYLRVTADREVVPLLFWGKSGRYLKALEGQDVSSGALTLYAPQYAVGGTWRSTHSVVNLDDRPGEITFEFTDRSGNSSTRVQTVGPRAKIDFRARMFLYRALTYAFRFIVPFRNDS